jgi:hypothetical protein
MALDNNCVEFDKNKNNFMFNEGNSLEIFN